MSTGKSDLTRLELGGKWLIAYGPWEISEDESEFVFTGWPDEPFNRDGLCLNDVRLNDGVFGAEVRVDSDLEHEAEAHLVFRHLGSKEFMFAGLGGWEYKFDICRKLPQKSLLRHGGWEPIVFEGQKSDIVLGRWYRLRVEFAGNDIDLFLGDACMLRYAGSQRDSYSSVGNIGFRSFGRSCVRFRNPWVCQRIPIEDLGLRLRNVDLSIIENEALGAVANRDLEEVKRLSADVSPKAVVVLLGSIAEAALLDLMQRRETEARECESATRGKLERWHLHTMIDVAKELKAIKPGTAAISHIMRGYRNLIHPGNSEAQSLEPGMSQAVAASDFILALFRDLVDLH